MRSLDEMAKLEKANPKPTFAVLKAKAAKVKAAYGLDQIRVTDNDETGEVFVKHAKQDNGDHILEIPLMSAAERYKLLKAAMDDLKVRNSKAGGEEEADVQRQERGTESDQEEAEAKELITSWHKAHPVVEEVRVVDGETTWDYFIDIGDKSEVEKGNKKKDEPFENIDETIDVTSKVKMTTEPHTLHGNVEKGKLTLILKTDPTQLIPALQNALSTIKKGDPNRESLSSALNTAQEIEFEYNEKENQILKGERKGTNETMYEFHVRVKSAFLRKREAELAVQLEAMAKHYNIRELDDFFSEPPAERYIPVKEAGTYIRKELYDKMHKWTTFRNDYVKKNKPDLIKKIKFVQTSGNKNDWENLIDLGLVEKNSDIKSYDPNVITYAVDHIDPVANLWNTEGFNSDDTTRRDHFLDEDNLQLVTHQWNSAKGSEGEYYKKFVTLGFTSSIATDVDINGMRFWDAAKNPI